MDGFIKWKKFTWKSVLFLIALVVLFMILQSRMEKSELDKKLMEAANETNKTVPMMVDSLTRFDNAIALPENKIQYNYTLIFADKETTDTTMLKNRMEPSIVSF